MMVFRNWFNEQYSRDASIKVKAVKEIYARNGKFMGSSAPYGYKKSESDRHILIIDEPAAAIVCEIFNLRSQGMGYSSITNHLNNTGIVPPRDYSYQGKKDENPYHASHKWCINTVRSILKNEAYIGNMVSLKQGTVSYKNRKITSKPKENWIRAENTHDAIIEKAIWNCVRDIESSRYRLRKKSDGSVSIFCGLLYCSSCGFKMRSSTQKKIRMDGSQYSYTSFVCGTYSRSGKHACSTHAIGENKLHKIILEQMQRYAKMVLLNEPRIKERISEKLYGEKSLNSKQLNETLAERKNRLHKLDTLLYKLYEEKIEGVVSESVFRKLMNKFENEYNECKQTVQNIEKEIKNSCISENGIDKWISLIKECSGPENLDKQILLSLIERIIINDSPINTKKSAREAVVIYKYVGDLSWLAQTD